MMEMNYISYALVIADTTPRRVVPVLTIEEATKAMGVDSILEVKTTKQGAAYLHESPDKGRSSILIGSERVEFMSYDINKMLSTMYEVNSMIVELIPSFYDNTIAIGYNIELEILGLSKPGFEILNTNFNPKISNLFKNVQTAQTSFVVVDKEIYNIRIEQRTTDMAGLFIAINKHFEMKDFDIKIHQDPEYVMQCFDSIKKWLEENIIEKLEIK